MRRIIWALGFSAALAAIQPANAQPERPVVIAKQQLVECMNRRMAASKTVSYNDAMRACKERQLPPKDTLASNGPGESGAKSH
jgi:hypothetical protein